MADCPIDIILIDAFENAVKFGNALFRLDDFKLALPGLFFRFVSGLRPGGRSFGVQPGLSPCDLERDFPLLRGWDSQPDELFEVLLANVKHFFTLLGKMFFTPYGKEFFTYLGKQIFTS